MIGAADESDAETYSGECGIDGNNVTWTLDTATKVLTIAGTGAMKDAGAGGEGPWYTHWAYIEKVKIEEGVTTIGQRAFISCSAIKEVSIPETVTSIGVGAFISCGALETIKIPNSVTTISMNAFTSCSSLKTVNIQESSGLETIGNSAFSGCSALQSIRIPSSITSIENGAFSGLTFKNKDGATLDPITANNTRGCSFTAVEGQERTLKTNDTPIVHTYTIEFNTDGGTSCESQTVTAGESINLPTTTKDENVFTGWFSSATGGTKVTSPYTPTESTTLYAYWANNKCGDNLTWTLSADQKTLTITGTGSMYDYDDSGSMSPWRSVEEDIKTIIIEDGVTTIGDCAFLSCSSLASVTIPNSVKTIGSRTFEGCTNLNNVTIKENSSLESIGGLAFWECKALTSISIPDTVTSVGSMAFAYCTGLLEVTTGNSVTSMSISTNAFAHCEKLEKVTIGNSVTSIGNNAFENCYELLEVTIGNSVTSIGDKAFALDSAHNSKIKKITIGNSVTSIGTNAFGNLTFKNSAGAQLVIIAQNMAGYQFTGNGNETLTRNDCGDGVTYALDSTGKTLTISKTGEGSGKMYDWGERTIKSPWDSNTNISKIIIENGVTTIGQYAFYKCISLTSIEISNTVKDIEWAAFYECSSLTSVTIPDSVTSISYGAFHNCTSLETVDIRESSSLESIKTTAFKGCTKLISIKIPNSVTTIGMEAFAYCTGLREVTIGNSVTDIGQNAFYGLTFYDSDGTTVLEQTVANLKGCTFTGDGDGKLKKTSSPTYTITFVTDGTSCEAKSVTAGQSIGTLPTTAKDGYTFNGWFTSASGGTKVTSAYIPTEDMTLYAQWTADTGLKTKGLDTNGQFLLVTFSAIITLTALALIITRKRP